MKQLNYVREREHRWLVLSGGRKKPVFQIHDMMLPKYVTVSTELWTQKGTGIAKGGGGFKVKVLVAQPCPTLCDPRDCSPPGSSVHGILQARILEWVAIPFSRGPSQPRD